MNHANPDPVFTRLSQKVALAHTAVVVIDMQNDFCADGGFGNRGRILIGGCLYSTFENSNYLRIDGRWTPAKPWELGLMISQVY